MSSGSIWRPLIDAPISVAIVAASSAAYVVYMSMAGGSVGGKPKKTHEYKYFIGIFSLTLPPLDLVGFSRQMPVERVPRTIDRTGRAVSRYLILPSVWALIWTYLVRTLDMTVARTLTCTHCRRHSPMVEIFSPEVRHRNNCIKGRLSTRNGVVWLGRVLSLMAVRA